MSYQIALDPALGVSAADFVAAWNDLSECRAAAEARVAEPTRGEFGLGLPPEAIQLIASAATSLLASVLWDCVKLALEKRGVKETPEKVEIYLPDGTPVYVVKKRKG